MRHRSGQITKFADRAGRAANAGASERSIMSQTGHRSVQMVKRYIRDGSLFRENSAGKLGLLLLDPLKSGRCVFFAQLPRKRFSHFCWAVVAQRYGSPWIVVWNFHHGEKPGVHEVVEPFVRITVVSRVCPSSSADGFEEIHCVVVHMRE